MARRAVAAGKRIAVSSNSHKAISNLLKAVSDRSRAEGVNCRVVQKVSVEADVDAHPGIVFVSDNDAPEIAAAHTVEEKAENGGRAWN